MKRLTVLGALACVVTLTPNETAACCGFHVSGDTAEPAEDVTLVLMRDGTRTVVSMQSSHRGPLEQFAWVIPVPSTLRPEHVKVLRGDLLDRVEVLASPRLVEYREIDPCLASPVPEYGPASAGRRLRKNGVIHIEARFEVGEYDIAMVSATDAEPRLRAHAQPGMKFLIARVDPAKVEFDEHGHAKFSPLRFHYDSEDFVLPIAGGGGERDLVIHVLAPGLRYRVADRANVTIPTNLDGNDASFERFDDFYAALVDRTLTQYPGATITEYARKASASDPYPSHDAALSNRDLLELGGDVLPDWSQALAIKDVGWFVPEIRAGKTEVVGAIEKETIRRIVGKRLIDVRHCYNTGLTFNWSIGGRVVLDFTIAANGQVEFTHVAESTVFDPEVGLCIAEAAEQWSFPAPPDGASVKVSQAFSLSRGGSKIATTPDAFVLTRLRIPHEALAANHEFVLEAAEAIAGGREIFDDEGELEQGAAPGPRRINDFQARYAIRRAWTGEMACEDPIRGRWEASQPPVIVGPLGLRKAPSPQPAPALTTVVETTPEVAQGEAPSKPATATGCACSVDSGSNFAALLTLLGLLGLRRARERTPTPR